MAKIDHFLSKAAEMGASDLHFSTGEPTRVRVDGDLQILDENIFDSETLSDLLFELLGEEEKEKLKQHKNLDKSFSAKGIGNFRLNIFYNRKGIAAVLRSIPSRIPTIADLALPVVCEQLCNLEKGLVLVTGPTGSGKSTTLAAMINHINQFGRNHILTVEDPVEFVHESKNSLVNQREIGNSCHSFSDALKYALREDPDVILVGEMRDLETISLALTAAETGHLVFGTLHTRGAGASVDRIIDSFPANQQAMIRTMLAESLKGVISQTLLKRASGKGRVAAHEIMVVNSAISNLIREGKTFQIPSSIQVGRKDGMISMDQSILDLISRKEVNPEEVVALMTNPSLLEPLMKNMPKSKSKAPSPQKVESGTFGGPSIPPQAPSNQSKISSMPSQPPPVKMAPPLKTPSQTAPPAPKAQSPEVNSKLQEGFKSLFDELEVDELGEDIDLLGNPTKKTG